jgi:hypothetical protein
MKPEDVIPDNQNTVEAQGLTVRKGSVAAFVANVLIICDPTSSPTERQEAQAHMIALVPALSAVGVFEVFSIRDPDIAALVEDAQRQ